MPEIYTYKVDGSVYDIPEDKQDAFIKKYPNAFRVESFKVDKDTFDIPLDKVDAFKSKYPDATNIKKKDEQTPAPSPESTQPSVESSTQESPLVGKLDESVKQFYSERGYIHPQEKVKGFQDSIASLVQSGEQISQEELQKAANEWGLKLNIKEPSIQLKELGKEDEKKDSDRIYYSLDLYDNEKELLENTYKRQYSQLTNESEYPEWISRAGTYAGSFNKRALSFLSDAPKTVAAIGTKINNSLGGEAKVENDKLYKAGKWIENKIEESVGYSDPDYAGEFVDQLFSGAGDMMSFMTGNMIAGKAPQMMLKGYNLTPGATTAVMGAIANGMPEYEEVLAKGRDANSMSRDEYVEKYKGQADEAALINQYNNLKGKDPQDIAFKSLMRNGAAGSMEALPILNGLSRISKLTGGKINKYVISSLTSGTEEYFQEGMTQYLVNLNAQDLYDESRKLMEGVKEASTTGFVLGVLTFGIGGAVQLKMQDPNTSKSEKAMLQKLMEEVNAFEGKIPNANEVYSEEITNDKINELKQKQDDVLKDAENVDKETREILLEEAGNINQEIEQEKQKVIEEKADSEKVEQEVLQQELNSLKEKSGKLTGTSKQVIDNRIKEVESKIKQDELRQETQQEVGDEVQQEDVIQEGQQEVPKEEVEAPKPEVSVEGETKPSEQEAASAQEVTEPQIDSDEQSQALRQEGIQEETEGISDQDMPEGDRTSIQEEVEEETVETKNIKKIPFDLGTKAKEVWQKYLTSRGNVPKPAFDEWIKAKGRVNKEIKKAEQLTRDFDRAVKQSYGDGKKIKITPEQVKELNDVMSNLGTDEAQIQEQLSKVPEKVRKPMLELRNHIDTLSREMVREGIVEGDLAAKFDENLGYYMTRTYRAHNDKKWKWENIPSETKNRAISFMRSEFPDATNDELDAKLRSYLDNPEMPLGVIKAGKLGSKDLSILKQRKDVPEPIRALLGEYTDPIYNYATSVAKMSDLIAKNKFLSNVREQGMGEFLFNEPTGENIRQIAAEGSATMEPLNGLYTTPEIAEAFQDFNSTKQIDDISRILLAANGVTKYGKTILSPQTHVRNWVSNFMFHIANGRNPLGAIKTTGKTVSDKWKSFKGKDNQEYRDYMQRLAELGVIEDSSRAGELFDTIKDSYKDYSDFGSGARTFSNKTVDKSLKVINKLYQVEDDVHKIYAYEVEYERYRPIIEKQNPEATPEEVNRLTEEKAAEITRNTMPTYSLVPDVIKKLRRIPFIGSFTSFPAEVLRTTYNTYQLASQEARNPDTRSIGLKRAAGMWTAMIIPGALSLTSRFLNNIDKDDDDDLRRFLSTWNVNSVLLYLAQDKPGIYRFIDLGYSDPHNYIKKPINAMVKGEFTGEDVYNATWEFLSPFLGEEIMMGNLLDVRSNKKKSGGKIYNEADPIGDQIVDAVSYVMRGASPGFITQAERIYYGATGQKKKGKEYDLADELLAVGTGQRITTLDIADSFYWNARRTGESLTNTLNDYKALLRDENIPERQKRKAYEKTKQQVGDILLESHQDYRAALRLQAPEEKLQEVVDGMRVNQIVKNVIEYGDDFELDYETGDVY